MIIFLDIKFDNKTLYHVPFNTRDAAGKYPTSYPTDAQINAVLRANYGDTASFTFNRSPA